VKRLSTYGLVLAAILGAVAIVYADPIQGRLISALATLTASSPLTGGGLLSGNPTIGIQAADGSHNGYLASGDYTKIQGAVQTTRTITATTPVRIAGGASADLSADRTVSCPTCAIGPGRQVLRMQLPRTARPMA
jgi:hypothetical protein